MPSRVGPVELKRRPLAGLAPPPAVRVLLARQVGFAGASDDDQHRLLNAFRQLLDALEQHLQVILYFEPGSGTREGPTTPPSDLRALDLEFLDHLQGLPTAQRRRIELSAVEPLAARIESWLAEHGLAGSREPEAEPPEHAAPSEVPPETFLEHPDHLSADHAHHRTWYIHRFPGVELAPGWLHRLAPPTAHVVIAAHIQPLPTAWMIDHLQRRLTALRAARLHETTTGNLDPQLAGALPTVQTLQQQLVASQERAFEVAVYATLTCPSEAELERQSESLEAAARSLLCRVERCTFRMYEGYAATRPNPGDPLKRGQVLHTSAAATLLPWLEADLRQADGIVIGRSQATGSPVQVDPFDRSAFPNANIGIFGHSGAGKTYLMSTLALGAGASGTQLFVIDPEHEYRGLAQALKGIDVPLALGSGVSLNVLDLRPSRAEDADSESQLGPAVADAVDLVATLCGGLDEAQRAAVDGAVRRAFADQAEPVLRDVARHLDEGTLPQRVLSRWTAGSLGDMFSRPTNVDLEAPAVVFGMRELREEMVAPVHFLLAEALWSRIKDRRRRRLLVVDELGILFEDATIRKFVVNLARRIRKYDGGLVFATQNPGDLLTSEAGSVVATNPAIHFFGSLRPGEAAKVQKVFQLSDQQRGRLEQARRGQFLLAAGAERIPVEVMAAPWQDAAMGRDPPDPFV